MTGSTLWRMLVFTLTLLAWCMARPALSATADESPVMPANTTIEQLRFALDSGRLSYAALMNFYLNRIARFDKRGPRINAVIRLNPGALQQARHLDEKPPSAHPKLFGIPFIAKDNFDTAGLPTSGGSAALLDSIPASSAVVVEKLLDEGAILVGKANMSELAASYGRLGYSSAGGLTVNPYNLARNASGSSSGPAAAVAADFATFAIGTDTSGSVRGPASVVGVVGLRPTLGLVSRRGMIPLALAFDTAGVLTRSVRDLAIVLDAIAGPDPMDAATLEQPGRRGTYLGELHSASPFRGVRLGVITNFRGANFEVDGVESKILQSLRSRGATLVALDLPKEFEQLWSRVLDPATEGGFKPQFERYLRALPGLGPKTLAQFINVSASPAIAESTTPMNPETLQALRKADVTPLTESPTTIRIFTDVIPQLRRQLLSLMAADRLQAFVFATLSCPASPRFDRPDPCYLCQSDDTYKTSYIASAVGFPEVTIPVAVVKDNLPVGYSFMGAPYGEAQILKLADGLRDETVAVRPPTLN